MGRQDSSGGTRAAKALHDEAFAHLRRRDLRPAQALLQGLQEQHAGSSHCLLVEGHCALIGAGDPRAAEALYERGARAAIEDLDTCDAMHAMARLCRIEERWEEAEAHYTAALALRPDCPDLSQEGCFAHAKRLVLSGQPAAAAAEFEAGLATAGAEWQPHFARERAAARALGGGAVRTVVREYREALRLGGLPSELALGETLSTLATHAEAEAEHGAAAARARAAEYLQQARRAFAACSHDGGGGDGAATAATACFRLGQTLEALRALGEDPEGEAEGDGDGDGDGDDGGDGGDGVAVAELAARLPGTAASARRAALAYGRAIALAPTMGAAYEVRA